MPNAATQITDTVINNLDNYAGLPILGYTLSWRAGGIDIQHDALVSLLEREGFAEHAPDLPTPRAALRRAIAAWVRQRSQSGQALPGDDDAPSGTAQKRRALIRPVNRDGKAWMSFTIVAEDVDFDDLGLEHATLLRFLLHKDDGRLICTTAEAGDADHLAPSEREPDIEAEIQPLWDQYRALHTGADVLRIVRAIVDGAHAVALRPGGGYYFVPESKQETVRGLRRLFDNLEAAADGTASCFILTLPQLALGTARAQLAQAAHTAIVEELAAMDHYLETEFVNAPAGTVRDKTVAAELAKYKSLRVKAEAYAELMGMRQELITQRLEALTEKARTIVTKKMASAEGDGEGAGAEADAA